jgi:hypothetical protein
MAMLTRLGVPELVAEGPEEAASLAIRVAGDPDHRARLSRSIAENGMRLFGDRDAVNALVGRVAELASSGSRPRDGG